MRAARGALKPRPPRCCHPLYRLPLGPPALSHTPKTDTKLQPTSIRNEHFSQ